MSKNSRPRRSLRHRERASLPGHPRFPTPLGERQPPNPKPDKGTENEGVGDPEKPDSILVLPSPIPLPIGGLIIQEPVSSKTHFTVT